MRPDRMPQRMMALSMKDQEELAEWQRHVDNDHKPYRRDCEECLRSMGRDRMRKRIECPDSYALNLDIMGPVNRGEDQDGTGFYYALVGAFTVPCVGDNPIAQGLQELGHAQSPNIMADEEASHRPWTSKDVVAEIEELKKHYGANYVQDLNTGEDSKEEDHKPGEHGGCDVQAAVQDPPQHGPQGEPPEDSIDDLFADLSSEEKEPWTPIEIQAWDAMNRRWQDKVAEMKNVKVTSLTFAIPMRSRHSHEVVRALSLMYGKIRSLNLPLIRIHTDRAREFLARPVQQWMQSRNVMQTVAAGDEAQGSGRVEREVQYIKETTRLLLATTRAPVSWWPLAMRQATEMRHRKQLQALGVPQLPLIPFGTSCMAKVKRWHKRDGEEGKWRYPMRKVVVWGPASDMSSTSRGYYIQAGDQWMKTTVVVIPNCRYLHDLRPQLPQPPMAMMDDMEYAPTSPEEEPEYGTQERDFEAAAEEFPASLEVGEQGEVPGHMPEALFVEQPPHCGEVPRRIHGKTPPDQVHESYTADVRTLQVRGEWSIVTNEEVMKNQYVVEEERMVQGVCELQHRELRKLEIEERYLVGETEENFGHLVHEVAQESRRLEARLASLQAQEGDQQKNQEIEETLVNRQVDLAEVRRDLADWTEAIDKEYRSLRGYNAIEPISEEQYLELQRTMDYIEVIPSMLVTVVKPPNRKKARIVACGNHSAPNPHDALGTTAGGLDSIVARAMVSVAAEREWNVYSSDIATAFLQAERRSLPGRATVVVPPTIVKDSNVMEFGHQERWLVRKALYGLAELPKDWARHRDRLLQEAAWSDEGGRRWKMKATPECHSWRIEEEGSQQAHAYLGVYVDDLLMIGEDEVCETAMKFLATKFQMQPYEKVTTEKGIVFCGYEIEKEANGDYVLSQSKYVEEMLRKRDVKRTHGHPLPKISEGPDEEGVTSQELRAAQIAAGELMWVTTRTRPDVAYATSLVSRLLHRRPRYAKELADCIFNYLAVTAKSGLRYSAGDQDHHLRVNVDASFAPPHEGFKSVHGVFICRGSHPLHWCSAKQPFITMSTAESELVGYGEGYQCGETISELLKVFDMNPRKVLRGDSKAGITQLSTDAGAWRTRHLRLRAWKLREAIQEEDAEWTVEHCPGSELSADGFTKSLQSQAFRRFRDFLSMKVVEEKEMRVAMEKLHHGRDLWQECGTALLGGGVALLGLSDKRWLGALLIAIGGMMKIKNQDLEGKEYVEDPERKHQQEPQSQQESQSQQEPWSQQNQGRMHEGEKGNGTPKQDPMWTRRNDVGPQTSKNVLGNTGNFQPMSWLPKSSKGKGRGDAPGLRAMRINPKDGEGSQGSDAMAHGRQARSNDGTSTPGLQGSAARRGASVFGGAAASSGGYGTSSGGASGAASVGDSVYHQQGDQHREVPGGRDPWVLEQFWHPPQRGSKDAWDLSLLPEGWLVRHHRKSRKRWFVPLHQSLPLEPTRLGTERLTVRFFRTGARMVTMDEWNTTTRTEDDRDWLGFTFFKLVDPQDDDHPPQGDPQFVSSARQDVTGPFPAGGLFDNPAGLMDQRRHGGTLTDEERKELTREANRRIRQLTERVDALIMDDGDYRTDHHGQGVQEDGMQRALVPSTRPYRNVDGEIEPPKRSPKTEDFASEAMSSNPRSTTTRKEVATTDIYDDGESIESDGSFEKVFQ